MKEKIKNILNDKNLWIFTAIVLIFFVVFLRMEFAVDSYATLTFSLKQFFNQFASSGRFLLIIAGGLLKILKIKPEVVYVISFITAIICMIVSLYKLYTIIENRNENRLPIIITTRFDKQGLIERFSQSQDEQLVDAIISKLYQMCYGITLKNIKEKASTSDQTKC